MNLTSSAFAHNGSIPRQYTCEGKDISPPLAWNSVPANAKSLALIVDDPDAPDPAAPKMTWVHWVLYNLPVPANGLPEAPASCRQGRWKDSTTGTRRVTAGLARRSGAIVTSTSSTRSMWFFPT
jgi:Raf kinase inhibitor-like YbhB/YbcL family protein